MPASTLNQGRNDATSTTAPAPATAFSFMVRFFTSNAMPDSSRLESAHDLGHQSGRLTGRLANTHADFFQRFLLRLRGAARAGDDRPGVAHRLPFGGRKAGDVADDRLRDVGGDVVG